MMFCKIEKKYLHLSIVAVLSSLSILPYVYFLGTIPKNVSFLKLIFFGLGQSVILNGVLILAIRFFLRRTDLQPLKIQNNKPILFWEIIRSSLIGSFSVILVFFLNKTLFQNEALNLMAKTSPKITPFFARFLACFYGGFYEEFLCRLFLGSGLYYLFSFFSDYKNKKIVFTVFLTSILFGIGHLPALFSLIKSPALFSIFRIILLNFIPGCFFGFLYFYRGFFSAVVAHFFADVMLHLILINF